uniref:Uncharacterized protein ycf33 n=1 Tax=Actinocyclus sp. (in: diatoms) TaxID=1923973 RepID=A0A9E8YBG7_9STRA|nr:hypothetical protein [Actinocyclus sp. (in: diatoms)]
MDNFWNNLRRYPSFFISSFTGLILVILTPLKKLFKIPKLRVIALLFIVLFLISLYIILKTMLAF